MVVVVLVRVKYPGIGSLRLKIKSKVGPTNMLWMFVLTTMVNSLLRCVTVPIDTLLLLQQEMQ